MMKFGIGLLGLALLSVGCAGTPHEAPRGATAAVRRPSIERKLVVEITDVADGVAPRTEHVPVSVVDDSGWVSLESSSGSHRLKLKARTDHDRDAPLPLISVELDRADGITEVRVKSRVVLEGRRTVLTRTAHGDGHATEVAILMP